MSAGSMQLSVKKNKSLLQRFTDVGSDLKVPWQSVVRYSKNHTTMGTEQEENYVRAQLCP